MKKIGWLLFGAAVVFFGTGLFAYPHLPTVVVSHWDVSGHANGSLPQFWGAFLFPCIYVAIAFLLYIIPRLDPRREIINTFLSAYGFFLAVLSAVFYYIYLLTLALNLGYRFDFLPALTPALAILFFTIGILLPRTKRNFSIGIRTPWTLANDTVWEKTHRVGGVAFKISGVIALLGTVFPAWAVWFILVPAIISMLGAVVYSYVLFSREAH